MFIWHQPRLCFTSLHSVSLPAYVLYFGVRVCLPPPSFARARPPADSKSSKLRADIDRCLVCIPRALMANGEGTKKKDEERESGKVSLSCSASTAAECSSSFSTSARLQPAASGGGAALCVGAAAKEANVSHFKIPFGFVNV